ncbi:MAG TPA: hypothetical protein VJB57_11680 [Dehalococcoidia bacterium]|nr:hypothetical protein [Dehalococcoidia bacterium]
MRKVWRWKDGDEFLLFVPTVFRAVGRTVTNRAERKEEERLLGMIERVARIRALEQREATE